jgi:hypothetical protein
MNQPRFYPLILALLVPACITAARPAGEADDSSGATSSTGGEPLLLDDFEAGTSKAGQPWAASADQTGSEAKMEVVDGGKVGKAVKFSGKLGKNQKPWPWVSLSTGVSMTGKADLSGVTAVRFWVKGDGKKYRLRLPRESVTDFAQFAKEFTAPTEWTQIEIPLSQLSQPSWGVPLKKEWKDVKFLEFDSMAFESTFEIQFDNVELLVEPGKAPPFGENAKVPDEPQTPIEGNVYVLDNFEGQAPANGAVWGAGMDMNNLGTMATGKVEEGGGGQKLAYHLFGKMGKQVGAWPWATLSVNLEPNGSAVDLTHCKGIRFKAKGDGKPYKAAFTRKAITDYGNPAYQFSPPKEWKQYSVPMERFKQPDWAKQVEQTWTDATSFQIAATVVDAPLDIWIDDVEFVFETGKPVPFKK